MDSNRNLVYLEPLGWNMEILGGRIVSIELREAQILAVTEEERDEWSGENPIIFAEQGPNRFSIMSWFFPEEDGVNVTEDLDTGEIIIKYFKDGEPDTILEEGTLYDWALGLYRAG